MEKNIIYNMDCLDGMKIIPDGSVNCCVTSPPYFGLRDYGSDGQIGLEASPDEYVQKLVSVFREVRRILRDDGTLWLNLGDTYATNGGPGWQGKNGERSNRRFTGTRNTVAMREQARTAFDGFKAKDLIGIPWMVAFALRSDGWFLRQDIIWNKPNPMPESVTDRCTKAHEYIFLLSKRDRYYYDQDSIMQEIRPATIERLKQDIEQQQGSLRAVGKTNGPMKTRVSKSGNKRRKDSSERGAPEGSGKNQCASVPWEGYRANKRSVWIVAPQAFKEAHFATFPEALISDCIKAGCPEDGLVIDPFMGAGTTAVVCEKLGRNYIGFELNPEYIKISDRRLKDIGLLFKS